MNCQIRKEKIKIERQKRWRRETGIQEYREKGVKCRKREKGVKCRNREKDRGRDEGRSDYQQFAVFAQHSVYIIELDKGIKIQKHLQQ